MEEGKNEGQEKRMKGEREEGRVILNYWGVHKMGL